MLFKKLAAQHSKWLLTGVMATCCLVAERSLAQLPSIDALSEDEQKQVDIAERFLTVLERSPRRGTALDRVYGHHVEFGTLDDFLQKLADRVKASPDDGTGWMLLGLFESQRGEDANAVDAFRQAEEHRGADALPGYYLGQSLLLIGQPEEAVAAFERAIERKPRRADMLEIYRQLGRVHQRAQRTEDAMSVWARLEALFPDDLRVQEQVAITLVEEGEYALALPRYEKLSTLVRDDYRRVMFQIEAAELKIRESRRDEGLSDFEALLANLNPESWLFRDVRRRIEDVFLRAGDQDGLVKYYERWITGHPEDVGGMARLARFLASSARVPEATKWMAKAIELAPSRTDLRKSFIDQLVDDQRYAEAVQQYALLVKSAPGNQDFLRDWGRLVLKDKEVDADARKREAAQIWNQIITARPDDALTHAQVADLYRQANLTDRAIELYEKAVELAPSEPQYREYLGEYYHILKRSDDALATWQAIGEGSRHNAVNVARLAEVYNSFGYLEQAVEQIAEACKLDAKDFSLQIKASEYHTRAGRFDDALQFIEEATRLAANDEERETALKQRIEIYQTSRRLDDEIELLAAKARGGESSSGEDWHTLARYFEADRRWADATDAVEQSLEKDPTSVSALTSAARIAELSGDYARAADMNRKLSEVDRRSRSDHLMNVARLEAQMGRSDEALQAGRDLIVSAPGNTDNYEFYAQLCFQLGKMEEGLDALRKAVRINPTEPHLIMALGAALSQQFRTDEAIEVYWRAFEKTEEIEDMTSLTMKLTELYQQINQFDRLIERFERDRRQEAKRREMTICLSQAHHTSGDFGTARMELESLLSQDTRDTNLLQQLSKLCEEAADLTAATEYQRQLVAIAPGHETEFRLAQLLQSRGDRDEASDILVKLTRREEDPARLLRSLDSLLRQSSYESVIAVTEPLLSEQRDDWELLYREGVAWASLEKAAEARGRFERLLSLSLPHDKLGVAAEDRYKRALAKARSENLRGIRTTAPQRQSPLTMLGMSSQVRRAVGLDRDNYYGGGPQSVWMPDAFGVARMAAFAWLLKFDRESDAEASPGDDAEKSDSRFDQLAAEAALEDADRETVYDWMYLEQLRNNYDSIYRVARRMARQGGREEQQFFLSSLRLRGIDANQQVSRSGAQEAPKKDPLGEEDLELMMSCFAALAKNMPEEASAGAFGGQVAYGPQGQMYVNMGGQWVQISGAGSFGMGVVVEELKLAGREQQANELLNTRIAAAKTAGEIAGAMNVVLEQKDFDSLAELYTKWISAAADEVARAPENASSRSRSGTTNANQLGRNSQLLIRWMGKLGADEENALVLSILDQSLDLAVQEGKKRRSQRTSRSRRRSSSVPSSPSFNVMYGEESIYVRLDYPTPNDYVDTSALMLLRQAYEVFDRNDVLNDLPNRLRERVVSASQNNVDDLLYEQMMLAYVLWWLEERQEAVELLTEAARQLADDPAFRLEVARLHEALGELDEALVIVESIAPRDQQLVQLREMMALQLAERLGDIDRARSAAERLFGLRLKNDAQLALVERMRRLGLLEMAEAVVARVHRRSGNQTSSLASLMALYQGQGKVDLAQQIAHTILRRTKSPLSAMANSSRNPFRYSRRDNDTRTQALRLLQQTGALTDLVARLEQQLERSPESPRIYEQLIEFYQVSNKRDEVQSLLEKAVRNRPDALVLRYQLAKQFEQAGKLPEACDQYLEILEKKPSWIADDLYSVRRIFQRAQRTLDLAKAIETMNLKLLGHPYYVVDLATEMLSGRGDEAAEENRELAIRLFERVFESFPSYRNQMISRLRDEELWKNERIYRLGKKGVVPSAAEAASQPWFGLNDIYSWSSGGRVNAMFHQMVNGVAGTDNLQDLRKTIEEKTKELPGWYGGQAMIALIDLKNKRNQQAKERLERLVADEEVVKSMPSDTGWIVGQELDQFEDTRGIALQLFEQAVTTTQSQRQMEYSPITRLVKLYSESGRKEEARQLMLKQIRSRTGDQYDQQYSTYLYVENTTWAANKMLELGFVVDSIRLFREMVQDPARLEQAGNWSGRPDQFIGATQNGLEKALASLGDTNHEDAMRQLLTSMGAAQPVDGVLDVMLAVPTVKTLRQRPMESQLVGLLESISKNEDIAAGIRKRLAGLQEEHPADVSVATTRAVYLLKTENDEVGEVLKGLEAVVADNPLDEIPDGRRPNSRQRRQALRFVPLWLVARECLARDAHRDTGERFARHALAGARRQLKNDHLVAILYDWGRLSLETGDREQAERRWSELLDVVTSRGERLKNPDARKTSRLDGGGKTRGIDEATGRSSVFALAAFADDREENEEDPSRPLKPAAPKRIPPLTLSEFRITVEIALAAAENDMPDLSRRALQKSLAGGIPVPDPTSGTPTPSRVFAAPTPSGGPEAGASSAIETEVATALQKILTRWKGGTGYAPREVYDLLHPIVLPVARSAEILMYADSSNLREAQVKSLGMTLVRWAKDAGTLDDLAKRIEERRANPQSEVPALVMLSYIAMLSESTERAQDHLEQLAKIVETRTIPPMVRLACHAAIPAADRKPLEEPAFRILMTAVKQQTQTQDANSSSSNVSLGRLAAKVNRYLANSGNVDAVSEFFESYLVSRQSHYSRYSGDYGQYLQWRDWASIAEEAAKTGVTSVALDFMGRVSDFSYDRYSRPSLKTAMAVVSREIDSLSPGERYEFWHDWTLPTEGRQTIRLLTEWVTPAALPEAFLPARTTDGALPEKELLSNLYSLVDAAGDAGKLDELREQARQAHEQELPHAEFLLPIVLIRAGDVAAARPLIEKLVQTLPERNKREDNRPRPDLWGDYLVYRACMEQSADFAKTYGSGRQKLRKSAQDNTLRQTVAHIAADFARREALDRGAAIRPGDDSGLVHWFPASTKGEPQDAIRPWWVVQEEHVAHISGPNSDVLCFAYPLTGDFRFSFDGYQASWKETDGGYGGVVVESQAYGSRAPIRSVEGHESFYRPQALKRDRGTYGRITVESAQGKLRYSLNNHLVYEGELSGTSPWLMLATEGTRVTTFRNFEMSGNPVIPRQVSLLKDDRMDGWNSSFFGESQPRKRLMAEKAEADSSTARYQQQEPVNFSWKTKDGVLIGEAEPDSAASGQSWVFYHRPLRDEESFRYAFYYVPGKSETHPTIGRLALLLRPDGIRSHWIGKPGWDDVVLGIPVDNEIVENAAQRAEGLVLNPHEWNDVELSLKGDEVHLSVNGKAVLERSLEPEVDRRFGLFRYKRQTAKVRDAVLSGNWPEFSPQLRENMMASGVTHSMKDGRLINRILGEEFFAHDAEKIVAKSRLLQDDQAYTLLKRWVLPSQDHTALRLYFRLHARLPETAIPRLKTGKSPFIVCPAIELVEVAHRTDRLHELAEEIQQLKTFGQLGERGKMALLALVAIKQQDDAAALELIEKLYGIVAAGLPASLSARGRAPEYVVAWQAAARPALRVAADDMAVALRDAERKKTSSDEFRKLVEALVGKTEVALAENDLDSTRSLTQWQVVPYEKPKTRALGHRPSRWHYSPGVLHHVPGETWGQMFFQSPLRGKFEIVAERTTHGHQEVVIAYGMHAAEPYYNLTATRVSKVMHATQNKGGELKIPRWNDKLADFRIVVDGSKITTFTNGVQIHEEVLDPVPDPWLVLQAYSPGSRGTVRDLRILGNPEIPEEIDLIDIAGWASWRADVFGDWFSTGGDENAPWRQVGEEIQGQLRTDRSATPRESLLMYQRPLLEDGEIEFESFYVPGEFSVHPAIGRSAFVIRPNGVKLHRLTGAEWDTARPLPPDNETDLGDVDKISLQENAWNRYSVRIVGDRATVSVNGVEVLQHPLDEPANERFFGLFRYSDQWKCRVRHLVYRGDWPKTLPALDQQQLAYPSGGPFQTPQDAFADAQHISLNRPLDELKKQGFSVLGPAEQMSATEDGLRLRLANADGYGTWPGLAYRKRIVGDFEATLGFNLLELTPNKEGWGTGFGLYVGFADPAKSSIELGIYVSQDGKPYVKAMRRHLTPGGAYRNEILHLTVPVEAGRLRVVRRRGELVCLIAKEQGGFRFLRAFAVGDADVSNIQIQNKSSDSAGKVDVVARDLQLRTTNSG